MPDVNDLLVRLRERVIVQPGEPITLTMPDGSTYSGTTSDTVQHRNLDGEEAATRIETMAARIEALEAYAREASRALNHLSGGGSEMFAKIEGEYYADPKLAIERTEHRIETRERLASRRAALAQPAGEEDGDGG